MAIKTRRKTNATDNRKHRILSRERKSSSFDPTEGVKAIKTERERSAKASKARTVCYNGKSSSFDPTKAWTDAEIENIVYYVVDKVLLLILPRA